MYVVVHDFDGPKQKPGYESYNDLHLALARIMHVASCTCKSHPLLFDTESPEGGVEWSGRHWSPVAPEVKADWLKRLGIK